MSFRKEETKLGKESSSSILKHSSFNRAAGVLQGQKALKH